MKSFTFRNIHKQGQIVFENHLYKHNHFPEMLLMYDDNFIQFKKMPLVDEFKEAARYLREYHVRYSQKHLKFYFPQDKKLPEDLTGYLVETGYEMGLMELYAIGPQQFPAVEHKPMIEVQRVSNENFESFICLKYEIDSEFGENFAKQKGNIHKRNYESKNFAQFIAFYDGTPAGAVDVIISKETAEIDGLVILDHYQRKGIGSQLQKAIMEEFHDKTVILVAEGEDTPREMYKRQNYQYLGFKYEVLKVYED